MIKNNLPPSRPGIGSTLKKAKEIDNRPANLKVAKNALSHSEYQ